MHDQNNVFYAVALSIFILITWQYFVATFLPRQTGRPHDVAARRDRIRRRDHPAANAGHRNAGRNDSRHSSPRDSRRLPGHNASLSIRRG